MALEAEFKQWSQMRERNPYLHEDGIVACTVERGKCLLVKCGKLTSQAGVRVLSRGPMKSWPIAERSRKLKL